MYSCKNNGRCKKIEVESCFSWYFASMLWIYWFILPIFFYSSSSGVWPRPTSSATVDQNPPWLPEPIWIDLKYLGLRTKKQWSTFLFVVLLLFCMQFLMFIRSSSLCHPFFLFFMNFVVILVCFLIILVCLASPHGPFVSRRKCSGPCAYWYLHILPLEVLHSYRPPSPLHLHDYGQISVRPRSQQQQLRNKAGQKARPAYRQEFLGVYFPGPVSWRLWKPVTCEIVCIKDSVDWKYDWSTFWEASQNEIMGMF